MTDLGTPIGSDAQRVAGAGVRGAGVRKAGLPRAGAADAVAPAAGKLERQPRERRPAVLPPGQLDPTQVDAPPEPALVGPRDAVVRIAAAVLLACAAAAVAWSPVGPSAAVVAGLAPAIAAVLLYHYVVHPRLLRWGATEAEVSAVLPGDDLIESGAVTTRSVTIDAPVEQVWSWIVEYGFGPEGWQGRSWVRPDLEHRRPGLPGLQALRSPGDGTDDGTDDTVGSDAFLLGAGFEVHRIEARRLVVSQADDGTVWCLCLEDLGAGRTRLVSRFTTEPAQHGVTVLSDPAVFMMERRMLLQVKARAESGAPVMQLVGPCAP